MQNFDYQSALQILIASDYLSLACIGKPKLNKDRTKNYLSWLPPCNRGFCD